MGQNEREPKVMDKITPAQAAAWELEHEALFAPRLAKGYFMAQAKDLRHADHLERKRILFNKLDKQNELLDAIGNHEIPIVTRKELATSGSR